MNIAADMDPTLNFQGEWYSTGLIVMTGTVVVIVTSIASWRLVSWLKNRKSRQTHKPLLDDVTKDGEVAGVRKTLMSFFGKGRQSTVKEDVDYDDHSETYSLKRSSTVQSKASLISSGSSRNSVPPMIVQSCQPSDIHIPERRQSSFSVDSGASGFEIGQYQNEMKNEGSDAEGSIKSRSSFRKKLANKGDDSQLSEALEEDEEDDVNEDKDKEEDKEKVGSLLFSLEHDKHRDSLTIHIIKATDLTLEATSSEDNVSTPLSHLSPLFDPYIRLLLLPEGKQKAKTRIVRRTRNPVFEETFTFYGMNNQKLFKSFVKFSVISHDRFSKDQMIGQVLLPITRKIITKDRHVFTLCRNILSGSQLAPKPGELFISLTFDPSNDKLTVVVLKARNLPRMNMAGSADPYVKVYFMCDGLRADKKKTQVKKRSLNPIYNETFHFTLPPHFQQRVPDSTSGGTASGSSYQPLTNQVLLRFVILDWDRVAKNEVMGKVEIGPEVKNDSGVKHWIDVMESPRKQLAVWHSVK